MSRAYIFTSLAMNQTLFFEKISRELQSDGHKVWIVCFHERSADYLKIVGIEYFNIFESIRRQEKIVRVDEEFSKIIKKFGLPATHKIFNHENLTFRIRNQDELKRKFIQYCRAMDLFLQGIKSLEPTVIQELGGFSSIQSAFYVSRSHGLSHYFLEPSFFKGRCFLIPNSFEALSISEASPSVGSEVKNYIKNAIENKRIVIPDKDRNHYLGLFAKIFRFHNLKRLVQKLSDQYIWDKQEEFKYTGTYVLRHLKMFWNRFQLLGSYQQIPTDKYIYYPLHVPMDVALTLRAPQCLDQYHLIDLVARSMPFGYKLVIKEHPAMVGVMDQARLQELLRERDGEIIILDPRINNFEVLSRAELVITTNSKSGAEGIMLGKKVMVLGDAFYRNASLVTKVESFENLDQKILECLQASRSINEEMIERYFQKVWDSSFPGEIYSMAPGQSANFCREFLEL